MMATERTDAERAHFLEADQLPRWCRWLTRRRNEVFAAMRQDPALGEFVDNAPGQVKVGVGGRKFSGTWDTWVLGPAYRPQSNVDEWLGVLPPWCQGVMPEGSVMVRGAVPGCDWIMLRLHDGMLELMEVWHLRAVRRGTGGNQCFEGKWRRGWAETKYPLDGSIFRGMPRKEQDRFLREFMAFQEAPRKGGRDETSEAQKREWLTQIRDEIDRVFGENTSTRVVKVTAWNVAGRLGIDESTLHDRLKLCGTRWSEEKAAAETRYLRARQKRSA